MFKQLNLKLNPTVCKILGHHVTKDFKQTLLDGVNPGEILFTKCGRCSKRIRCMFIKEDNRVRFYTHEDSGFPE